MNVCHIKARFQNEFDGELDSKTPYLLHTGFRVSSPALLFGSIYANSDLIKYKRKVEGGSQWLLLTYYGQTYFPPQNALLFAPAADGQLRLAMVGSSLTPDPFRVILKRVVLTGYPFKAKGNRAVVRCMFYTPEDVKFFRRNEVYTKRGLKGKIQESLGTHGLMKCVFNDVIKQSETVCMNLFKRVFPKWPENTPKIEN
jgi:pre-rRNA-processing protein TSR1